MKDEDFIIFIIQIQYHKYRIHEDIKIYFSIVFDVSTTYII